MDRVSDRRGSAGEDSDAAASVVSIGTSARDMDTREVAFRELGETEEIRLRSLERVRALMAGSPALAALTGPDVGGLNDSFLLRFLRLNKFNAAKSVEMIEGHLRMKAETPRWFAGLGDVDAVEKALELLDGYVFVAPGRDRKGRKVLHNVPQRLDPARHSSTDTMKAIMMTVETLLLMDAETQVRGLSYVFYCRGLTLKHVGLWTLADARKMFTVCEKNVPLRHRAMFVVETPFGMGAVIEFAKSFVQPKMRHRIHVVPDVRTLHLAEDRVLDDPGALPVEFLGVENGGERTISDMAASWKKTVKEHMPQLKRLDDLRIGPAGPDSS